MPTELEAVIETIREKYEAAKKQAEFYAKALQELEGIAAAGGGRRQARKPKTEKASAPATRKPPRTQPVKPEVTASEAVTRLLAGCKLGLPASEILQYVSSTYGHQRNSVRTTLYNLKKKGKIERGEDGIYSLAESSR
jgi:hypothetical protein